MATGSGGEGGHLFQLLPSDFRAVKETEEYAKGEENELKTLTVRVQKMGFWRQFFDSKVAEKEKGYFNINFSRSDPSEITAEIENFLEFYETVIDAALKVDDKNKTKGENENPLLIIIDLNEKLMDMFDVAKSGLETTTSRTVTELYRKFLSKQMQLENKLKKLELVYQKQQFSRETAKLQKRIDDVKNNTGKVVEYKEQSFGHLLETIHFRKKHNEVLQELTNVFGKKKLEGEGETDESD